MAQEIILSILFSSETHKLIYRSFFAYSQQLEFDACLEVPWDLPWTKSFAIPYDPWCNQQ